MRTALHRYVVAPLTAWIPDITRWRPRTQAAIVFSASIAIHLLIILVAIIWTALSPDNDRPPLTGAQSAHEPIVVTLMSPPPAQPVEKRLPLLEAEGLKAADENPENAEFEADRAMKAGSSAEPTGILPMPSQAGRERESNEFADQDVVLGNVNSTGTREEDPGTINPSPVKLPEPAAAPEAQPAPAMPPLYTPQPVAEEEIEKATKAAPEKQLPAPARETQPNRSLAKREGMDLRDTMAFAAPREETPVTRIEPLPTRTEVAKLSTPVPAPVRSMARRYQERLERTHVEGSFSREGPDGVDAISSPMGLFKAKIKNLVGSRWNIYIKNQMGYLVSGSVRFRFTIAENGDISEITVVDNSANQTLADVSLRTLQDTVLGSIPEEAAPLLRDGKLEYFFTFTIN